MVSIDELLALAEHGQQLVVPDHWAQGRTVFGGLSAALLNQAMTRQMTDVRPLRMQNTQFVAPLLTKQPCELQVLALRAGRNVTQLQASLMQNGRVAVQANAAFGRERASKIAVPAPPVALNEPPKKPTWLPQIPKVTPKFHRHIDIRFDDGGLPYTGKKTSHYHGWMRFSKPPLSLTTAHLIALIDVWPPTVLQQLRLPVPASTLSWNLEFVHPLPELTGHSWLAFRISTVQAGHGYVHTDARLCDEHGQVLAFSRQLDTVFD